MDQQMRFSKYFAFDRSRPSLLRLLRLILSIIAVISMLLLAIGLALTNDERLRYLIDWQTTPMLALNTFLLICALYSFFSKHVCPIVLRTIGSGLLAICNLFLTLGQVVEINRNGGCASGDLYNIPPSPSWLAFENIKKRCYIQMTVGSMGIFWSLLLAVEAGWTVHERRVEGRELRKRETERQDREDQYRRQFGVVHLYQPDLSLEGTRGDPVSTQQQTNHRAVPGMAMASRRVVAGEDHELDELPAYEQRQTTGLRAVIMDMSLPVEHSPSEHQGSGDHDYSAVPPLHPTDTAPRGSETPASVTAVGTTANENATANYDNESTAMAQTVLPPPPGYQEPYHP
ncbi:hypothetical protein BGW38_008386 [Lunasporangiospora selenospora]|uniref:Uncharacterized protein n=1 Tax=Lunasporangiospora selenospora TaxID=979761 RepID=A0A9P6FXT4_9FUNG|nr:hypothetical protein BGW38_008386 [Lunasporangiospora selenospora]